ncbi:MAG: gamma-butyrobetaine hydroxylase-like domain-containing protein [Alphaproteobacteria bacterium]
MSNEAWPRDLTFDRAAKALRVSFDDGAAFTIPFELLRVYSPSAEVRGHRESERIVVMGKENVGVTRAEPVGNYAVRIVFDDGHDSGLYSWALLYELGRDREKKTNEYFMAQLKKG